MINCLAVGIGGFFGSILRYLMGMLPFKNGTSFPINTLIINVIGAFVIGLIVAYATRNSQLDSRIVLMLKVGLCGGFTTFSTFSNETFELIHSGRTAMAVVYAVLSVVLCVIAVFAGQSFAK